MKYRATALCLTFISLDFQSSRYWFRILSTHFFSLRAVSYFCQSFSPCKDPIPKVDCLGIVSKDRPQTQVQSSAPKRRNLSFKQRRKTEYWRENFRPLIPFHYLAQLTPSYQETKKASGFHFLKCLRSWEKPTWHVPKLTSVNTKGINTPITPLLWPNSSFHWNWISLNSRQPFSLMEETVKEAEPKITTCN